VPPGPGVSRARWATGQGALGAWPGPRCRPLQTPLARARSSGRSCRGLWTLTDTCARALRRGRGGGCPNPPTPDIRYQHHRARAPTHAPAGAGRGTQPWARPAVPCRVGPQRSPLAARPAAVCGPSLPPREAAKMRSLAGKHRAPHRSIGITPEAVMHPPARGHVGKQQVDKAIMREAQVSSRLPSTCGIATSGIPVCMHSSPTPYESRPCESLSHTPGW
jgi:hypothetical protein